MINPILVTQAQYATILWMIFNVGMLHFMSVVFMAPHKREENESDY